MCIHSQDGGRVNLISLVMLRRRKVVGVICAHQLTNAEAMACSVNGGGGRRQTHRLIVHRLRLDAVRLHRQLHSILRVVARHHLPVLELIALAVLLRFGGEQDLIARLKAVAGPLSADGDIVLFLGEMVNVLPNIKAPPLRPRRDIAVIVINVAVNLPQCVPIKTRKLPKIVIS